jgi:hypothetical protein
MKALSGFLSHIDKNLFVLVLDCTHVQGDVLLTCCLWCNAKCDCGGWFVSETTGSVIWWLRHCSLTRNKKWLSKKECSLTELLNRPCLTKNIVRVHSYGTNIFFGFSFSRSGVSPYFIKREKSFSVHNRSRGWHLGERPTVPSEKNPNFYWIHLIGLHVRVMRPK